MEKQKERFEKYAQWLGIPRSMWYGIWCFIEETVKQAMEDSIRLNK